MECQICKKERCISKHFKENVDLKICDDCAERLGYDYSETMHDVREEIKSEFEAQINRAVQAELPGIMAKIIKESDLEFELKVI